MKFEINDKVKLIAPVSYLKTSDNMPMLRPPECFYKSFPEIIWQTSNGKLVHRKSLGSWIDYEGLTKKYFSKPFLSISGNEKICLEISNMWKKNF